MNSLVNFINILTKNIWLSREKEKIMNGDNKKPYYIGLDMGTSSCGWAVTDENYNIMRGKGKDMWGVRLFEEASTAEERRQKRAARRRLQREKQRIAFVKSVFADEIEKIDPGFFRRLEESSFHIEDKSQNHPFSLFNDNNYTDKDFHADFPTASHLIKALEENDKKYDIRLIYLATIQKFHHRGHFLNNSLENGDLSSFEALFQNAYLYLLAQKIVTPDFQEKEEKYKAILSNQNYKKSKKELELKELLNKEEKKNKSLLAFNKFISGGKEDSKKLFPSIDFDEDLKPSFSFSDANYEEKINEILPYLDSEEYSLIESMKAIYDWSLLSNLMKDKQTDTYYSNLSSARVGAYEKHKSDLKKLKELVKKYTPEEYFDFFRNEKNSQSYSNYVGAVQYKGKKKHFKHLTKEEFYKAVKKLLDAMPQNDLEVQSIYKDIELEDFLPKQMSDSNGVIPNQVHAKELKSILENASHYYPFLNAVDESGLSQKEKILQMYSFQIPYYIGPLANKDNKGNGWMIRNSGKENQKIYPWNFEEVVNEKETANEFIKRMIKFCTYLGDEKVLPKESLLYQKYAVLNELNSLKINGQPISVAQKQLIYEKLFKKGKRVTSKGLINFLKVEKMIDPNTVPILTGFDQDFKNTLSSYRKFCEIFKTSTLTDAQIEMAENIIEWSTVFGDSKKYIKEKIKEKYPDITKDQIKRILSLNFKDWGQLSKEFLELEGEDYETGEIRSIIQSLWETNHNLMQLLSERFSYKTEIENKSKKVEKSLFDLTHEDLNDLYISAPVKRMVWQAILILKDIVKVKGYEPAKLFVEMTRSHEEKKRTVSRKNKLLDLYKNIKDESRDWIEEIKELKESDFRIKKLYLYYTQMGKDMYSGESIDLDDLFKKNLYDIDHIYPRHYIKDDSLNNNLVLVRKESNAHKKDNFPLETSIQNNPKVNALWNKLLKYSLISQEKFDRLTRKTKFTESELASFVNRQIVETGQATKTITDIFKHTFPDSQVVYVKAKNVSEFRKKFDILKCRDVNNLHHAQDAYLNIVVGNVYDTKFTQNPLMYIKKLDLDDERYHMDKLFEYSVKRNGEVAWIGKKSKKENDETHSIITVKDMVSKTSPIVTKKSYEYHGEFWDETIIKSEAVKSKGYVPLKTQDKIRNNISNYGGKTSIKGSDFFLVESTKGKKRIRTIEYIPLYLKNKLKTKQQLKEYAQDTLGLIDPTIRLKSIKKYSLLNVDGALVYLTGRTGDNLSLSNAKELYLDFNQQNHIRNLSKFLESGFLTSISEEEFRKNNEKLYKSLEEKHSKIFNNRPNPIGERLGKFYEAFKKLSLFDQAGVLMQILKATSTNEKTSSDLRKIGGTATTGAMKIPKNITSKTKVILINQSPSGLFENEIDLLTI